MYLIIGELHYEPGKLPKLELLATSEHSLPNAKAEAYQQLAENCEDGVFERVFIVETVAGFRLNPTEGPDEPICLPLE